MPLLGASQAAPVQCHAPVNPCSQEWRVCDSRDEVFHRPSGTSPCPRSAALCSILSNVQQLCTSWGESPTARLQSFIPSSMSAPHVPVDVDLCSTACGKRVSKISMPLSLGFWAHLPEHLALAKSSTSNIEQKGSPEPN